MPCSLLASFHGRVPWATKLRCGKMNIPRAQACYMLHALWAWYDCSLTGCLPELSDNSLPSFPKDGITTHFPGQQLYSFANARWATHKEYTYIWAQNSVASANRWYLIISDHPKWNQWIHWGWFFQPPKTMARNFNQRKKSFQKNPRRHERLLIPEPFSGQSLSRVARPVSIPCSAHSCKSHFPTAISERPWPGYGGARSSCGGESLLDEIATNGISGLGKNGEDPRKNAASEDLRSTKKKGGQIITYHEPPKP